MKVSKSQPDQQPLAILEAELLDSWRGVTQATYQFLELLRDFDQRQGYVGHGHVDCAQWLNWRCGISRGTAQEKVRVARALRHLPHISAAFCCGELSYSKVRAITRIATPACETSLLARARANSASELEAYCARLRNGDPVESEAVARRVREGRSLVRFMRDDGTGTLSVELPQEELALVMQAIDKMAALLPSDSERSLFATAADALVEMAKTALAVEQAGAANADSYQVVVHVDADALSGRGGESDLPLPTIRRICCDGSLVPLQKNKHGKMLNVGRRQRVIPVAIKRALAARDRSCRFPGCHHTRYLDAHHIKHWADGGHTAIDNLLLLCSHHHTLLHEGGFRIEPVTDGQVVFVGPDGGQVPVSKASEVREVLPTYWLGLSSAESSGCNRDAEASWP